MTLRGNLSGALKAADGNRACLHRIRRAVGGLGVLALLGFAGFYTVTPVQAQDSNLQRKVERLQKELNDLQRFVYKGGKPPAGSSSSGAAVSTDVAARMQLQITRMQDQVRSMNGRVEEIQHRIAVLEQRFDRMADDLEIRLQKIEDAVAQGGGLAATSAETGTRSSETRPSSGGTPGSLTVGALGLDPGATPRVQYDFAFDLLKKRNYEGAGVALKSFLDKNPDHELAGNAIYWLGETHYVQKEYKLAAKVFLDGYQRFPTGAKAPDNLLKLGMSLSAYGDTNNACKTFKKLLTTFPKAPARITKSAKNEQKKLKCK